MKINKESAIPSPSVTLMGPLLPPPTAVYAHSTEEGYSVSWAPSSQAKSYEVVLSPDPNFENKTCEVRLPAREGPLNLRPNNLFNSSLPDACRSLKRVHLSRLQIFLSDTRRSASVLLP